MISYPPLQPKPYPRRRFASGRAVMALVLREMASSYGRSPGGYLWAILEPVGGIALLTIVFAAAFHAPPLGISFAMYYATGMLPFLLFNDVQSKVATALMYSKQLLTYPTVTYLDAILARFLLNLITQVFVAYLIFVGAALFLETRITPDMPVIIQAFVLGASLALGVGTLNAFLFTKYPVAQRAWSILMRPMFVISGVFILLEDVPAPYDDILWWNPLIHILGLMRAGFYGTYDAAYVSIPYVMMISLGTGVLGLVFLNRYHRDLINI